MDIANQLAHYLQTLSDDNDGISTDDIIEELDRNYQGKILSHKMIEGHGEWAAILVFNDKSCVKIKCKDDSFDVITGIYNPLKGH